MFLRYAFALLVSVTALLVHAQSAEPRYYRTAEAFDQARLKHLIQAVRDLDPDARVSHSDDMTILVVKANPSVSDADVRGAFTTAGVTVLPGTPDLQALGLTPAPAADTPPVYVVTGDAAGDLQRYQQAVAAWNAAHPDQPVNATPVHLNQR